jgi:hypothetical protein
VHTGFWDAFRGVKFPVLRTVQEQLRRHPGYSVVATGHSLGGAVATFAGAYLRKADIATDIYTYGSPRAGNAAFASFVSGQKNGRTIRVTNMADPITAVPSPHMGFAHTSPEYWFAEGMENPASLRICERVGNLGCSGQYPFDLFSGGDHNMAKYAKGFEPCPGKNTMEDAVEWLEELVPSEVDDAMQMWY